MLDAEVPIGTAALVHLEKQTVTILIGAGIREGRSDPYSREFCHRFLRHTFPHRGEEPQCGGKGIYPHITPTLGVGWVWIATDLREWQEAIYPRKSRISMAFGGCR